MFINRKCYDKIKPYIETGEVIVIHGARQTGKTTLMKIIMHDLPEDLTWYFDLEDSRYKELLEQGMDSVIRFLKQKGFYKGQDRIYLFIDEIQYLGKPSSFLKLSHDHFPQIKLIVSGSSSFEIKSKFKDSLVGRTVNFELYPPDFEEFLWFKNRTYKLKEEISDTLIIEELKTLFIEFVLFGAYPKIILTEQLEKKERYLQQIIDTYIKSDIRDLANIKHIDKFNKLLYVLAQQSGQLLNVSELANTSRLSRQTVEDYLFVLEQTYIIKLVKPFSGNVRSELFKTPKVFFYDTGLLNMLTKKFLPTAVDGQMFETAIFSELVKNFGSRNINFWRTMDKKEIDFILMQKDKLVPIEVKLNSTRFKFTPIKYFVQKYDTKNRYCISLEGELPDNPLQLSRVYPWEIYSGSF